MTFNDAVTNLKAGQKVRRAEWTVQNLGLEVQAGTPTDADPLRLDMWMTTASGKKLLLWDSWLPSEVEQQADDWQIVP